MSKWFRDVILIPVFIAIITGAMFMMWGAWYSGVKWHSPFSTEWLKMVWTAPVPMWVLFLLLVAGWYLFNLYRRSVVALNEEREKAAELTQKVASNDDFIQTMRKDHTTEIAALRQVSTKQGFVDSPMIHFAWDAQTRWRWSYSKSQRVLRIQGMATIELDNTRRCPLITGVQIEGAQFVGEFSHFQLVPGQRAYRTLKLDFVGVAAEDGEPLKVKLVFTCLKGELFPTKETTFEPSEGKFPTGGEVAVQKKNIMPLPPR